MNMKPFIILILSWFVHNTSSWCTDTVSAVHNQMSEEGRPGALIGDKEEEGWRFRQSLNFMFIPANEQFNVDHIHQELLENEAYIRNLIHTPHQKRNIVIAKISIIFQTQDGRIHKREDWFADKDGKPYVFLSGKKRPPIFEGSQSYAVASFSDISFDTYAEKARAFFLPTQRPIVEDSTFYQELHAQADVSRTLNSPITFRNSLEDNGMWLDGEKLLSYYFATPGKFSPSIRRIVTDINQYHSGEIRILGVVLHIHSSFDPCRTCAPFLSLFCSYIADQLKDLMNVFVSSVENIRIDNDVSFLMLVSSALQYDSDGVAHGYDGHEHEIITFQNFKPYFAQKYF